jgi:hypothetical protein
MGSGIGDAYQNYDAVFKDAITLFKDKSLKFMGIKPDAKIIEILSNETKEVSVTTEFSDLVFKTDNGYGIHIEEEVDISVADLRRFCGYSAGLQSKHNMDFQTVIITARKPKVPHLKGLSLQFAPVIINMATRDGDQIYNELKREISAGEEVNELDLVCLPMCHSQT